jgi:hypothetical protein
MAEAPRFSPDELDRLEDALESIESLDLGLLEDESPHVSARLAEYRSILALSRAALPMEEVPPGILESVLATARDSTADELGVGTVTSSTTQAKQSWWDRFRKTLLLPSLAVAGSAALILLIVQPTADDLAAKEASSDDEVAARSEPAAGAPAQQQRLQGSLEAEQADPMPGAAPEPGDEAAAADEDGEVVEIATSRMPSKMPPPATAKVAGGGDAPTASDKKDAPANAEDEGGTTQHWDAISRGDRARRDGDCATARKEYETVLSDADDRVRARAIAGIGMCEEVLGRTGAAQELYQNARDLDPELDGFIDDERPSGADAPAAKPRPKAKKKRSSKRNAAELNEPFEGALE